METFALVALNFFYYQTWIVIMSFTWMLMTENGRNERMAIAAYVFTGYVAVAWHPLIEELFKWLKQ